MAREEQDREDLLREARALVERAELSVDGFGETVVAGFRRDGCASFYFGAERTYQFNTERALRRAHLAGLLYKSEGGRLASLERVRTAGEVQLVRHDLSGTEADAFLNEAEQWLARLADAVASGACAVVGQVPAGADVVERIGTWLAERPQPMRVADAPHAR